MCAVCLKLVGTPIMLRSILSLWCDLPPLLVCLLFLVARGVRQHVKHCTQSSLLPAISAREIAASSASTTLPRSAFRRSNRAAVEVKSAAKVATVLYRSSCRSQRPTGRAKQTFPWNAATKAIVICGHEHRRAAWSDSGDSPTLTAAVLETVETKANSCIRDVRVNTALSAGGPFHTLD